jgi:hypothetical protein
LDGPLTIIHRILAFILFFLARFVRLTWRLYKILWLEGYPLGALSAALYLELGFLFLFFILSHVAIGTLARIKMFQKIRSVITELLKRLHDCYSYQELENFSIATPCFRMVYRQNVTCTDYRG